MLFSHISDTHLGLVQYGSEEREQDVYHVFNQAIDISIKDHVDFVIFAGDIFHVPNPNGTAVVQMANALKRLKKNNIDSFFILGDHDISRIRTTPIPYVYHNLEFSRYIGQGNPIEYKGILIVGFDKIKKKGFLEVDISGEEARSNWIELDTRQQFSFKTDYDELAKSIDEISIKIDKMERKPIVEIKIQGENIETDQIQQQITRLKPQ